MQPNTTRLASLAILALSALSIRAASTTDAPPAMPDLAQIKILALLQRMELEKALPNVLDTRRKLQEQWIEAARGSSQNNNEKVVAIFFLGTYRMEGAAGPLSEMIDFQDLDYNHGFVRPMPLLSEYPAADALVHIGTPAIPWIVHNLARSDSPTVRKLSASVMSDVLGPSCAFLTLQEEISRPHESCDVKSIERLKAAQELIMPHLLPSH